MIVKTFFLAKIIHRIGTRTLRDKKTLHENYIDIAGILRGTGQRRGDARTVPARNVRDARCGRRRGRSPVSGRSWPGAAIREAAPSPFLSSGPRFADGGRIPVRCSAPHVCGSGRGRVRMEASPSPVYGAALLMRFGLAPIRGSNPRASAIDQALRPAAGVPGVVSGDAAAGCPHIARTGRLREAFTRCPRPSRARPPRQHRGTYYDRLMAIRHEGDWEGWLCFFLTGVATVAREAEQIGRSHG
jgi:hypothetical protein